jgi:hypothetical protein
MPQSRGTDYQIGFKIKGQTQLCVAYKKHTSLQQYKMLKVKGWKNIWSRYNQKKGDFRAEQ